MNYPLLVLSYVRLWMYDTIDYYYKYLILTLPFYVFSSPLLTITQNVRNEHARDYDSDDQVDVKMASFDVMVSQMHFVFADKERRLMSGAQLRPFIDDKGRFFLRHIQRYLPTLVEIDIEYVKAPSVRTIGQSLMTCDDKSQHISRVLDVKKRNDLKTGKSCKFGVYL